MFTINLYQHVDIVLFMHFVYNYSDAVYTLLYMLVTCEAIPVNHELPSSQADLQGSLNGSWDHVPKPVPSGKQKVSAGCMFAMHSSQKKEINIIGTFPK